MDWLRRATSLRERAAALIIVLAFVVLFTVLVVAYLSRTTGDRQVAHGSFNQSKADQFAASAMNNIIGDLRQEITNGSTPTTVNGVTIYTPTSAANMIPQRSGNAAGVPNLIRRSVSPDNIVAPGLPSRASAVNSTTAVSANGRAISLARWNSHYLLPKYNTASDDYTPQSPLPSPFNPNPPVANGFTPPDWVFVTSDPSNQQAGRKVITTSDPLVIGRYAYAIYDEGGLLDMNVAGYPSGTTATQSGRKGCVAFADLTALPSPIPTPNPVPSPFFNGPNPFPYQVDFLVGWRNYATTQPTNNFPDSAPAGQAFAKNFQPSGSTPAANFYSFVVNNTNGFLRVRGDPSPSPSPWPNPSPAPYPWNGRTDQMFLSRQQLIAYRKTPDTNNGNPIANTSQFDVNALQYLGTFSRETNSPSFSPPLNASEMGGNDQGGTYAYRTNASSATAINPNFLRVRVTTLFTRFDGTIANRGEPLVKTRFPLSRLAWITYKGPSAVVYAANPIDPAVTQLYNPPPAGVGLPISTIQAGTAANVKACFGLVWDSRAYVPATGTTPSIGQQWVYDSPSSLHTGGNFDPVTNATGNPASDIKRLDIVASELREPDFFELLRATILDGSLGQNTGGGVTGGATVFPDVHMSNKALHILTIGASIIDQADPDSIPTRIQFKPPAATGTNWWTAYGVESLPYITQLYPISGVSPASASNWATYLLFQLSNPHTGPALSPAAPQVHLRVDGGVGLFTGGNGQTYATATAERQTSPFTGGSSGQSVAFTAGVFPPSASPSPVATPGVFPVPAVGSVSTSGPGGFERLPTGSPGSLNNYVGLRILPDHHLAPAGSGNPPQLTLFFGTDSTHQFNATMEYLVPGTASTWVPYNHFIGINDQSSWINGATVPVRQAQALGGLPNTPNATLDNFNAARLLDSTLPYSFMKADPRATRFGIFQMNLNPSSTVGRITDWFWPTNVSALPNGYGGVIADGSPPSPGSPVAHAPLRFSGVTGASYYPATFCINDGQSNSIRNTVTTSYADNDAIIRSGDAAYPDPTRTTNGSSTPWSSYTVSGTTFRPYWPVMLNRPFRNVAELGYAFRDLPWKSLDLFSDKSADAGLLDVFSIHDGAGLWNADGTFASMGPVPTMVAGKVNLNTQQAGVLQSILAGAIWDELTPANSYSKTTSTTPPAPDSAQTMAPLVVSATSTTPAQNKSELVSRVGLPNQILPIYSGSTANQTDQLVKSQREAVPRALASVTQTRTWNLMIDVIAQSGRYPPNASSGPSSTPAPTPTPTPSTPTPTPTVTPTPSPVPTSTPVNPLANFVVEGEQRYWVHVAIDRFTGQVIDKQIEVVNE
jgi:hypothetical protein